MNTNQTRLTPHTVVTTGRTSGGVEYACYVVPHSNYFDKVPTSSNVAEHARAIFDAARHTAAMVAGVTLTDAPVQTRHNAFDIPLIEEINAPTVTVFDSPDYVTAWFAEVAEDVPYAPAPETPSEWSVSHPGKKRVHSARHCSPFMGR